MSSSSNEDWRARASSSATSARTKRRPGRKSKGSVSTVMVDLPGKHDSDHVLASCQRKVAGGSLRGGFPPSMREIGEVVGLSGAPISAYEFSASQQMGYLPRRVGKPKIGEVRLPGHQVIMPPDVWPDVTASFQHWAHVNRPAWRVIERRMLQDESKRMKKGL
jgi:hypothetical protein